MYHDNILSMELLAIGVKSAIGDITEKFVKDLRIDLKEKIGDRTRLIDEYKKAVKMSTGLSIDFNIIPDDLNILAGVHSPINFFGHGSRYFDKTGKVHFTSTEPLELVTEVDLKNATVKGGMADMLQFTVYFSTGILSERNGFTVGEITAFLLHEYGHAFNVFMTLGEYIWLNYYLTDGIEIIQGKKNNKYKVALLDATWLEKNLPKEDIEEFVNGRDNDAVVRKAIMTTFKDSPRHHLTNNPLSSKVREEQLADLFASRLGYGRDLVTALAKLDKFYGDGAYRNESTWFAQTLKIMLYVIGAPGLALATIFYNPYSTKRYDERYDSTMERLTKVRRDLIQQIKSVRSFDKSNTLQADIAAIDAVIKEYTSNPSVYDSFVSFFRPGVRKMRQNKEAEENLELLFNNDLFLAAAKLNNL